MAKQRTSSSVETASGSASRLPLSDQELSIVALQDLSAKIQTILSLLVKYQKLIIAVAIVITAYLLGAYHGEDTIFHILRFTTFVFTGIGNTIHQGVNRVGAKVLGRAWLWKHEEATTLHGALFSKLVRQYIVTERDATSMEDTLGKLVDAYLEPFTNANANMNSSLGLGPTQSKIHRATYMGLFAREVCNLCVLIQIVENEIYLVDPRNLRNRGSLKQQMRLREVIAWIKKAVQMSAKNHELDGIEMVISLGDSVLTTDRAHTYSLADVDSQRRPVFSIVGCWNGISSNIPFPMTFGEAIKDGQPDSFMYRKGIEIHEWDERILDLLDEDIVPWESKQKSAIFVCTKCGPSGFFQNRKHGLEACGSIGCSGIAELAHKDTDLVHARFGLGMGQKQTQAHTDMSREEGRSMLQSDVNPLHNDEGLECIRVLQERYAPKVPATAQHSKGNQPPTGFAAPAPPQVEIGLDYYPSLFAQQKYMFNIYTEEQYNLWSNRLPLILFSGSCPIISSLPCGQWFEPLLVPWQHYVPVDIHFVNLTQLVRSLATEEKTALNIMRNSQSFAKDYLNINSVAMYVNILLKKYKQLLETKVYKADKNAIRVHPVYAK